MPDGLAVSSEEGTPQGGPLCFAALTPAGLPIGRLSRCARFTATGKYLPRRAGQRTRKERPEVREIRRRLQHLRKQRKGSKESERKHHRVAEAETETGSQRKQKRDRKAVGTKVPRIYLHRRTALHHSKQQPRSVQRPSPRTMGSKTKQEQRRTQRPMEKLRARLAGILPVERMETPDLRHRRVDTKTNPVLLLAAMAQQRRTASGPPANGSACGASQNGKQQQRSMGNGPPRGDERSAE